MFSLRYVRRVAEDTGTILTSPLRWDVQDWLIFGGVGLATGGLMFLDTDINDALQRNQSSTLNSISNVVGAFGTWVPALLVGGMYVAGSVYDVPSWKAASADALEAGLIAVGLMAMPVNFIAGRSRPEDNQGSTSYHPFTAGSSLPSLTTTFVFSVASVMADHADNLGVSLLAYGIATAVGLSRMYDNKHWASDVLLGAALGTAVGKVVVKLNDQRRADARVSVVPLVSDKMQGAMLQVKF